MPPTPTPAHHSTSAPTSTTTTKEKTPEEKLEAELRRAKQRTSMLHLPLPEQLLAIGEQLTSRSKVLKPKGEPALRSARKEWSEACKAIEQALRAIRRTLFVVCFGRERDAMPSWLKSGPFVCVTTILFLLYFIDCAIPSDQPKLRTLTGCAGEMRNTYQCPFGETFRECTCDPPRADGGGCNETDADMCNAGGLGPYFRYLHEMPEEERYGKICFGALQKWWPQRREPKPKERRKCSEMLRKPMWPVLLQGAKIGTLLLVVATAFVLWMRERRKDRKVANATVRIGMYDRRRSRFFNLGSGAVVSDQGHILTAAHVLCCKDGDKLASYRPPPSDAWAPYIDSEDLIVAIGLYQGAGKPCRWAFRASAVPLTHDSLMRTKKRGADGRSYLLDLAVCQIDGRLELDPGTFEETHSIGAADGTEYEIVYERAPLHADDWKPVGLFGGGCGGKLAAKLHTRMAVGGGGGGGGLLGGLRGRVRDMLGGLMPEARYRIDGLPQPLLIDRSGVRIAEGEEIAAAGWASPDVGVGGQRNLHLHRLCCITDDHGQIKSYVYIDAGSSGGPCVNSASEIIGVNSCTMSRGLSCFRSVRELRPNDDHPEGESHGLPAELYRLYTSEELPTPKARDLDYLELGAYELPLDDVHLAVDASPDKLTYAVRKERSFSDASGGGGSSPGGGDDQPQLVRRTSSVLARAVGKISRPGRFSDVPGAVSAVNCRQSWLDAGATHVAFAYPTSLEEGAHDELEKDLRLAGLLLGGGLVYLRQLGGAGYEAFEVVGVKVMGRLQKYRDALQFSGPKPLDKCAYHGSGLTRRELEESGQMRAVTFEALVERGIRQFCFLPPGSLDPTGPFKDQMGFAYIYEPCEHHRDCVFWIKSRAERQSGFAPLAPLRQLTK